MGRSCSQSPPNHLPKCNVKAIFLGGPIGWTALELRSLGGIGALDPISVPFRAEARTTNASLLLHGLVIAFSQMASLTLMANKAPTLLASKSMAGRFIAKLYILCIIAMAFSNSPAIIISGASANKLWAAATISSDDTMVNTTMSALLAFKDSVSLDPTSFLASWNTSDYCSWRGVSCLDGTHDVVALDLHSNQLTGIITPRLGDLSHLSNLTISNNSFHGSIPPQLGKLASLVWLDLSDNRLTGPIPSSLGNCTLLQVLELDSNSLSGQFPPFLTNLTHLYYVGFSYSTIIGTLPPDIHLLSDLQYLQIYNSTLTGELPPSITNCTKLMWLNLGGNKLSGPIPSDWSKLAASLQHFVLSDNFLVGSIPHTLSNCTELTQLALQMNSFIGEVPESLGRLALLQDLELFDNNLTGTIPTSIMNCSQLVYLELGMNNLSGHIPQEIGRLTQLQWLYLSEISKLEGGIPHTIGGCKQLQHLSIASTNVGGSLPMSLYNLTNLQYLRLYSSNLSGSLSEQIQHLTLLLQLRLDGNAFGGQIPTGLGNLKSLQGLELHNNNFRGPIPPQLSGCTSIYEMDLSYNLLSGTIPSVLGQLHSLSKLHLHVNQLSGQIPDMFGSMVGLQSLNVASNMLTGPIPASFSNLTTTLTVLLDMSLNVLSGAIPPFMGNMQMLVTLRLSGNQFTGQIPSSLGNCQGMQVLDLSINQLQGDIPSELGEMKSLQYLNLSHNQLSGNLPPSLGALEDLVSLNVSYNALQGVIPPIGIYANSSPTAFLGNPGLCGYPLQASCSSDHSSHHSNNVAIIVPVCTVGGAILIAIVWYCARKRGTATASEETVFADNSDDVESFVDIQKPHYKAWTADELRAATNGFDPANVIGIGGMSVCYRGVMQAKGKKKVVAVKRLRVEGDYRAEASRSFVNELKTLCKVRHRNLVKVEGYCVDGGEVALVMELMDKGNLDEHLHHKLDDDGTMLSWQERVDVAADVAEGLVYLHHEYVQPIIHCDLKPTNILLTSGMPAKISDFGIARLVENGHPACDLSTSQFRGSWGYAAPEYAGGSRISTKSDVYSYGVLLLELVTGFSPTHAQLQEQGTSLHTWVRTLLQTERTREMLDTTMQRFIEEDSTIWDEVVYLLNMGVKCTNESTKDRPTMREIRDSVSWVKWNRLHKPNTTYKRTQEVL